MKASIKFIQSFNGIACSTNGVRTPILLMSGDTFNDCKIFTYEDEEYNCLHTIQTQTSWIDDVPTSCLEITKIQE